MLPLGDLIRDLDVRVVAGDAGLENAVRWVHISELEDPTPWLSGGELLLTTGMALQDPVLQRALSAHERLERIVLSERGLDGVAEALASLIGGPAVIFDARGTELVRRAHRRPLTDETVAQLRE